LALAFILDYFDHSLRTPEDVDHYLEIPALGSFWRKRRTLDQNELNRVASGLLNPALGGEANRFVAVAGSVQGEGAYEVARGLAETLARDSEKRTLFLDLSGDALGAAPDGRGIVDVAEGRSGLSDVIGRRDSLYVVGKGSEGAVPTYLWNSERMAALLENLRGEYDHVVAAVPPILDAPDARHLTHHGDGLLLVVRSGSTRREVVQRALNTLGQAERKVAGAVLTGRKQHIPNAVYRYL
jgi:Mrp family chromosome partitioning ATPase